MAPLFTVLLAAALTAASVDTRLIDAAKKQDASAVRTLLQQKIDVNAQSPDGATARARSSTAWSLWVSRRTWWVLLLF